MNQSKPILKTLIAVILIAGMSFMIGSLVNYLSISGVLVAWKPLPQLPKAEKAVHFEIPLQPSTTVYVLSEQGQLYRLNAFPTAENNVWLPETEVISLASLIGECTFEDIHNDYVIRQAPGTVVHRVDCNQRPTEGMNYDRMVILDTGEVWQWRIHRGIFEVYIWFFSLAFSIILGLILFIFMEYKRHQGSRIGGKVEIEFGQSKPKYP